MASSDAVIVNPEHLDGGDGTLEMALLLWLSRNGPIVYNTFQSLFFHNKPFGPPILSNSHAPTLEHSKH